MELNRTDDQLLAKGGEVAAVPFKLKKILVPTDFSSCSQKALQYAIPLAKQFSASLTLLHVVKPISDSGEIGMGMVAFPEDEVRGFCEKRISAMARTEVGGRAPTMTVVRLGQPVSEIIDAAREQEIDLIIMSTHGHTGLKHVLLGSVTENVVRYAKCPVLVVREREHEFISS
ncbi:MAG: uspa protein [Pedosphaera sp.]|nr:uspa protein [Pedosphaera sp.]